MTLIQLSMKTACICATTGPSTLEVRVAPVLGILRVAGPLVGDADAAGEADAAVDDQQLAVRAVVQAAEVRTSAAGGTCGSRRPAAFISSSRRLSIFCVPTQSSSTCTLTPARARSASASANSRPIVARPVDVGLEGDRLAAPRIAASIAGKISVAVEQRRR